MATVFQTATPFVPGTLIVFVDGIAHATVVEHPASGSFALGWAPDVGSSLEASWRERSPRAARAAAPPGAAPAPATAAGAGISALGISFRRARRSSSCRWCR